MQVLKGKTALITGGSSGIGLAIAEALATAGVRLFLVARSEDRLERCVDQLTGAGAPSVDWLSCDLSDATDSARAARTLARRFDSLDLFVYCAYAYERESWADGSEDAMRTIFETNVFSAVTLTRALLPGLISASGDVVFLNSSVVNGTGEMVSQYSASKHALRSLADSLRAETNASGVRVLSVFPGRTATPGQKAICDLEGREFNAPGLLQPASVAEAVISAVSLAPSAELTELHIRQRRP